MVTDIHCPMVIGGLITMVSMVIGELITIVSMVITGLITVELYNNDHRTLETFHSDSDFNNPLRLITTY